MNIQSGSGAPSSITSSTPIANMMAVYHQLSGRSAELEKQLLQLNTKIRVAERDKDLRATRQLFHQRQTVMSARVSVQSRRSELRHAIDAWKAFAPADVSSTAVSSTPGAVTSAGGAGSDAIAVYPTSTIHPEAMSSPADFSGLARIVSAWVQRERQWHADAAVWQTKLAIAEVVSESMSTVAVADAVW